jgi:DNA-binding NarL/FixJ family response regulator
MLEYQVQPISRWASQPARKIAPLVSLLAADEKKHIIPLSIFSSDLAPLEAVVKYLRERFQLTYEQLGLLLDRSTMSVATTYHNAIKKQQERLPEGEINVPLTLFCQQHYSVLESVVAHLKKKGLSYAEIATALHRDQRTIFTVHRRWQRK